MVDGDSGAILEAAEWSSRLKAVVIGGIGGGAPFIRIEAELTGPTRDRVLSWAHRQLARGARVAWLLAENVDDLPQS